MLAVCGPGAGLARAATGSFSVAPEAPVRGHEVAFAASDLMPDDETTTVHWDFGDGAQADGRNVTHAYGAAGTKTVTMTLDDGLGPPTTVVRQVVVNAPPLATFGWAPTVPQINDVITFDATGSGDPEDGGNVTYVWDFGDGQLGGGATVQHAYPSSGTRTVTLSVTDTTGTTTTTQQAVRVNALPAATFRYAAIDRVLGQPFDVAVLGGPVAFDGTHSADVDGSIAAYEWDFNGDGIFGDDTRGSLVTALGTPGVVNVGLRVTDSDGAKSIFTRPVLVDRVPIASFTFSPTAPTAGQRTTFESTSSDPDGDLTSLRWDLDGNGTYGDATGPTATRVFGTAGTYPVALQAIDGVGIRVVEVQHVPVRIPGTPSLNGSPFSSTFVATPLSGTSSGGNAPSKMSVAGSRAKLSVVAGVRVAIAGRVFEGATRITRLLVNAPSGATVSVRCRGRGCPVAGKRLKVPRGRHSVRVRAFEQTLVAGTRVFVSITKGGFVGKQIQFTIRRTQPPVRRELCLVPGKANAVRCTS